MRKFLLGYSFVCVFGLPIWTGCSKDSGALVTDLKLTKVADSGPSLSSAKRSDVALTPAVEHPPMAYKDHWIYQLDGQGGRIAHQAQFRFLPTHDGEMVIPWGLAQMDNGEIAVAGVAGAIDGKSDQLQTVVGFSRDSGATWSAYQPVEGCSARPMMLAYLGNGVLSFMAHEIYDVKPGDVSEKPVKSFSATPGATYTRLYSHDYGRTWTERVEMPTAPDGWPVELEGSSLIDRDENGVAVRIGETGCTESNGPTHKAPISGCIRWSSDGGRTWDNFSWPEEWKWESTYEGETYEGGVCEGSMVRAANGWIVAALRPDSPVRFAPLANDSLMGTAVSISKDDGKTWSPLNFLFGAGRHHPVLVRQPNGDLVMSLIRRLDMQNEQLVSYRSGCDAVVSRDNGLTWDVDHRYILDEFSAIGRAGKWYDSEACGHLFSVGLDDGMILTTYGNYRMGGSLILWKP